ncbi:MAG: hypothetical protein HY851_05470 [candidate division Zixibacteria bacterium]|nr:hypothetical protein [candidate division Zixibacteria bacterium]
MDVRVEQLIDMGLTAAGLLAAGGFCATVFSMFRRRRVTPTSVIAGASGTAAMTAVPTSGRPDGIEFISFGSAAPSVAPIPAVEMRRSDQLRRNRADIIRQARQMLERGATNRDITQSLAMSEGEVALLRQDINRS